MKGRVILVVAAVAGLLMMVGVAWAASPGGGKAAHAVRGSVDLVPGSTHTIELHGFQVELSCPVPPDNHVWRITASADDDGAGASIWSERFNEQVRVAWPDYGSLMTQETSASIQHLFMENAAVTYDLQIAAVRDADVTMAPTAPSDCSFRWIGVVAK